MRRFVLGWKVLGHAARLQAQIVNYADDFVICCRGTAAAAMQAMRDMMARLRLTVNDRKTRTCRVSEEPFRFLGYTIGRCYSSRTGESYVAPRPSPQAVRKLCRAIGKKTGRAWLHLEPKEMVKNLHVRLTGWVNYFQLGQVSKAYRRVGQHVRYRLRTWLCARYGIRGRGETRFPDRYLSEVLGLRTLAQLRQQLHEAKA